MEIFLLVLSRLGGFFVTAPFWGHMRIARRLRVAIALILAWLSSPLVSNAGFSAVGDLVGLVGLALREVVTGGIIGFTYAILFFGVHSAGRAAGMRMGFVIVNVIDPRTQKNISILGQFKFLILAASIPLMSYVFSKLLLQVQNQTSAIIAAMALGA